MRKLLWSVSCLAVVVLGISLASAPFGCNRGGQDEGTIRILWAAWAPADALQELGKEYQAATGIPVTVVQKSWAGDFQDTTFNEFRNNGRTYDIIIGDSQWLGLGVVGNHYVELTDWVPQNIDVDEIAPAAWKWYCEYPKGSKRLFAVPCEADAMAWAYRKDLFEDPKHKEGFKAYLKEKGADDFELAPPKTWAQLSLIAHYFKEKHNIPGLVMPTARDYDMATMSFQQIMWAWGGEYGDYTTNQVKINSPQTIEALKFFTQLLNATSPGGKNMTFDEVGSAYFGGQEAAMACNFLAFFPAIAKNPDYGPRTGYFNMPAGPGGRFATLGGQGMSINAHISEARQQRAKDFIKWFSSRETQEKWAAREGCFTSNLEVMKTDEFKRATPYNFLFEEAFGMMNDFWAVPEFDEMMKVCQREFCAVFQDGKDAAQAVATIQREHEEILKKAGRTSDTVAAK